MSLVPQFAIFRTALLTTGAETLFGKAGAFLSAFKTKIASLITVVWTGVTKISYTWFRFSNSFL
ncbi:hypothetical protein CoNPh26_CDS0144 [Staphylococcus phage S-CoN_Ph26]|nr:hypothetical protein CoNPh26_CDS0144 [Staphylococcus phage S-CoN_Ph26]